MKGDRSVRNHQAISPTVSNDAKSDLTKEEFINLCRKVVEHSITSS